MFYDSQNFSWEARCKCYVCFLLRNMSPPLLSGSFKISPLILVFSCLQFAYMWFDLYSPWIWFIELLKTMALCLLANIFSVILGIDYNMLDLFTMFHIYFMQFFFHFPVIFLCVFKSAYFLLCYFSVHLFFPHLCLI